MLLCLLALLTLAAGFANKERCTGPLFNAEGRSGPNYQERAYGDVCYSDIQNLWLGRDVNHHVLPYVHGGITPGGSLTGGSVEYPVLTGVLMWMGAFFAHTDAGFLTASALLLAPFGLLTAWLLGRLSGWRALWWALGPPVVLYAFHNWDLAAVACATAAVFTVHRTPFPLRRRGILAGALLGLGFAFKIYPALFAIPLALHVFLAGGRDLRSALESAGSAVATAVLANLPFALLGPAGWWASFEFQSRRKVDLSSDSVWYWAFRQETGSDQFQSLVGVLSPLLIATAFGAACWWGWRASRRTGEYPWLQVSAAALCGFLLLHKVHSPQYALWLLPFFALLRVRSGWILAYFLADAALGISIFRWMAVGGSITDGFTAQALMIGIWGRAALLVGLYAAFLDAPTALDRDLSAPRATPGSAFPTP